MRRDRLSSRPPVAALLLVASLSAGCSRPPRHATPAEARRPSARFDSATVARLCATPDSAQLAVGGCELRNQAPRPELVRPRRP